MLRGRNVDARLSGGNEETGGALCFQNPVEHDVMDCDGRKLAGAGQRRTRFGLLHQGSVAVGGIGAEAGGVALAGQLAEVWERVEISPPGEEISDRVSRRYGRGDWTTRR
jgi:lipoate-protein ligase A